MTAITQRASSQVYLMLIIGVLATSSAAILITYAQNEGVPSAVIAAGRLTLSALVLTPFALWGGRKTPTSPSIPLSRMERGTPTGYWGELRGLNQRDLVLAGAAGFWLAIHFATWIASLEHTSVLISVVMVSTGPLWVGLLEFLFLRAIPRPLVITGLVVAIAGGLVIGLGGATGTEAGDGFSTGALLALAGAVSIALYLVIGRRIRAKLSLVPYIWLVYGIAAAFLLGLVALSGESILGYSATGYLMIVLLAIAPQLIGHTSFNYALKYLSATYVSIATQLEPIGSAVAAAILFQQLPQGIQIVGSAAVLIGVLLATLGQRE